jgi:hypothetical protein
MSDEERKRGLREFFNMSDDGPEVHVCGLRHDYDGMMSILLIELHHDPERNMKLPRRRCTIRLTPPQVDEMIDEWLHGVKVNPGPELADAIARPIKVALLRELAAELNEGTSDLSDAVDGGSIRPETVLLARADALEAGK